MKNKVLSYMKSVVDEHTDNRTDEVNLTSLAEDAAHYFDHDEWLDDETHFVWDLAIEVSGND